MAAPFDPDSFYGWHNNDFYMKHCMNPLCSLHHHADCDGFSVPMHGLIFSGVVKELIRRVPRPDETVRLCKEMAAALLDVAQLTELQLDAGLAPSQIQEGFKILAAALLDQAATPAFWSCEELLPGEFRHGDPLPSLLLPGELHPLFLRVRSEWLDTPAIGSKF
jgi:hypothetical protein